MALFTHVGASLKGNTSEYLIQQEIARGGMGAIYKALDVQNERVVAIKEACLDPSSCEGKREQIREQLLREMHALKPLDHPNIPKIYDQFPSHHNEYLVMEFVDGETLLHIQQRGLHLDCLLEESRVLGWLIQTLEALTYLHERDEPIIHRDIKPENLILASDGRVMLVDFGLMKQVQKHLTDSGPLIHAVGTIEYAPPEQYAEGSGGTDARTDIYSLGATMYYLLAGHLPPRSVDRMLPTSINITRKLPSLCETNPTVSRRTEQVIFKAMEIDPDERYQSARQMREAICPRRRFIQLPF
jgi:serine/threonine protein kinase